MSAELSLICRESSVLEIRKIISFTFVREAYTPYTLLNAVFDGEDVVPADCTEVSFSLNGKVVHHGLVDQLKVTKENGVFRAILSSRSFSSLLLENQLAPGFYMNLSINDLMDNYFQLPYISHEDSSADSGYIFVKSGSVMWDGVVNLAYKLGQTYPYISGCDKVMINPKPNPDTFIYNSDFLSSCGSEIVSRKVSSHFHMADISGKYGSYDYEVPGTEEMKIVRHKHFELDNRFLYDPDIAAEYRGKLSSRGWRRSFCTYYGYSGEELSDLLSINGSPCRRICKVMVVGDASGIRTELSFYDDLFNVYVDPWR